MMDHERVAFRARKRRNPWIVFFAISSLLVVLLFAILIGVVAILLHRTTGRIEGKLARIPEAGEPASGIELDEFYQLPPGVEDTTELWLDATRPLATPAFTQDAGQLPIVSAGSPELPPPGMPWEEIEAAESLVRKYRESLDIMHEAAKLDGAARYPTDLALGFASTFDHIDSLKAGAWFLELEAHVRAHRGDTHGAARSIRTLFALARSLEREPTVFAFGARLACDDVARRQLKSLLPTVDFSETDLTEFQEILRSIDYHDGLYLAMLGERVLGIISFENPEVMRSELAGAQLLGYVQGDGYLFYLDHMDRLVVAARQPWSQTLPAADRAEAELDDLMATESMLTKTTHVFAVLMAGGVAGVFHGAAGRAAMNDAADAAIAIELYRRRHDKLPERLEDLVPDFLPEVPIDPFDGAPLKYVVREREYLIYSIGRDRVDNGGTAGPLRDGTKPDVVFAVQQPP